MGQNYTSPVTIVTCRLINPELMEVKERAGFSVVLIPGTMISKLSIISVTDHVLTVRMRKSSQHQKLLKYFFNPRAIHLMSISRRNR